MENEKNQSSEAVELNRELGSSAAGSIHCLTVIGQIEGHYLLGENAKTTKYEHILPLLAGIEESCEIKALLLMLNTVGGDVEAGLAIAELVASMSKPTASLVLGGGHSIGVPLAVAARRSFIVPSATMTIHPVRTSGLVVGVPQSFESLKKMQDRITDFILRRSQIKREELEELLTETGEMPTDVGSVIDGNRAVEIGLIDEIGGIKDALQWLRSQIDAETNKNQ